jgi:hypothetical protein
VISVISEIPATMREICTMSTHTHTSNTSSVVRQVRYHTHSQVLAVTLVSGQTYYYGRAGYLQHYLTALHSPSLGRWFGKIKRELPRVDMPLASDLAPRLAEVQLQLTPRLANILRETGPRMTLRRPKGMRITMRDHQLLVQLGLVVQDRTTLTQLGSDLAMHLAGYPTPPAVCEAVENQDQNVRVPAPVAAGTSALVIDLATVRAGRDTLRSAWTEAQFRLRRRDGGPAARERAEANESIRRRIKAGTFHAPRS